MAHNMNSYSTLTEALENEYRTDELKQLAALICPRVPTIKSDRIQAIVATLFKDPKTIFAQLSQSAQHAVAETVHAWDGVFDSRMFRAKYSASPWLRDQGKNGQLLNKGDLLSLFVIANRIPVDLLKILREIVPAPPADQILYAEDGPDEECTVRETCRAALTNAAMVLARVAEKKIRVSAKTGRPTAATVKAIWELLCEGDWYDDVEPIQAFAWPLLLQGGGLVKTDGTCLELNQAGLKALNKDLAAGIKTIWNKWEKSTFIDEFSRVSAVKGQQSGSGRTMTSSARRRPMINALLRDLQPGKWIDVDELSRLAQSRAAYSFSLTNNEWNLYIGEAHYGGLGGYDTWPLLQLRYLLVYLFEYCATLGLLDVAYIDPARARDDFRECWGTGDLDFLCHCDGLISVRINALGAYVLGHTDTFAAAEETRTGYAIDGRDVVLVHGEREILPGQALYLDTIGDRQETDRWRLSVSSLMSAINSGRNLAEIRTTLAETSTTGLSPEVELLFREVELLFREVEQRSTAFVEVGRAPLIECNPELRKHVLTDKKISRLCLPAGDRYLVIFPGKEKQFSDALAALGFTLAGVQ